MRKVEVFEDGKLQFANKQWHTGDTDLGLEPVPALDAINADTEFEGVEISQEEFEEVFAKAVDSYKNNQQASTSAF